MNEYLVLVFGVPTLYAGYRVYRALSRVPHPRDSVDYQRADLRPLIEEGLTRLETLRQEQENLENQAPAPSFLQRAIEGVRNRRQSKQVPIPEEPEQEVQITEVQDLPREPEIHPSELKIEDLELKPGAWVDMIQIKLQYLFVAAKRNNWELARDKTVPVYIEQKWWDYLVGSTTPTATKKPGLLREIGVLSEENRLLVRQKRAVLITLLEYHKQQYGGTKSVENLLSLLTAKSGTTEPEVAQIEEDEVTEEEDPENEDD